MRKIHLICMFLFFLLAACTPATPPPQTAELMPTVTPPSGTTTYQGCAFTVNVPAELTTDGISWYVVFTPTSGEPGWVSINAKKMPGIDLESAFEQAADQYGLKIPGDQSALESVTVIDYLGQPLTGLQSDFTKGKEHYRVLVFVRPDTLLGDLDPQEVIYEITAQAPVDSWNAWEAVFTVIFQSFQPTDCGGV
jgi:hypothetical protein